jgi:hypothetical protein
MRRYVLLAATGLVLAFGAASADAQSLLNRPSASPYALLNPAASAPVLTEGRSVFIENAPNAAPNASGPLKTSGPVTQQLDTFGGR